MIYNQINLPLSFRKVIKKSLASFFGTYFFMSLILLSFFFVLLSSTLGISNSILIIFGLILILIILLIIYQYLYYKTYTYEFDEDGALITKGVISRATGNVQYKRLQNIYMDQDFLDRIFGLYDVHYETAGETSGFYSHVDGLNKENADKLLSFLLEKTKGDSVAASANNVNNNPAANINAYSIHPQDSGSQQLISITRNEYPISRSVVWVDSIVSSFWISFLIVFILFFKTHSSSILGAVIFFLILFLFIFIISFIYFSIWYKNFYFSFEADKGEIRKKVIGQSVSYLYYNRIQNVNVRQGILDRIFGIYSLNIETAGETSGSKFNLSGLSQEGAEKIREFLLERTKIYKNTL